MQQEISSGTMLGIVLIALAAIIGLGFGVFAIAKGVANEGVVNVQDNLTAVSASAFTDFDQKVVTGTQVVSAYKTFEGKSVAVLINTQALSKSIKCNPQHDCYVFSIGDKEYLNYNAILAADAAGAKPTVVAGGDAGAAVTSGTDGVLTFKDGTVTTEHGFCLDDKGSVVYDSNVGGMSKAGNCEYISSSAKFQANLVKDASGTTVGVVFTQMAR